jgi:hypothetical protein
VPLLSDANAIRLKSFPDSGDFYDRSGRATRNCSCGDESTVNRVETIDHLLLAAKCLPDGVGLPNGGGGDSVGQNDPSRFGLFVESDDPRIGVFAASFAAHLLNNFVFSLPGEDDRQFLVQVAGLIHDHPETQAEIARLTGDFNESVANINSAIQKLAHTDLGKP